MLDLLLDAISILSQKERQEAEQRLQRERLEKERLEKERQDRERRQERERQQHLRDLRDRQVQQQMQQQQQQHQKQISANEAVDHHFQMSMEFAKKLPTTSQYGGSRSSYNTYPTQRMGATGQQWTSGQMKQPLSSSPSPMDVAAAEEHRRRLAAYEQDRRSQEERDRYYLSEMRHHHAATVTNVAAARGAPPPPAPPSHHHLPPPAHGGRSGAPPAAAASSHHYPKAPPATATSPPGVRPGLPPSHLSRNEASSFGPSAQKTSSYHYHPAAGQPQHHQPAYKASYDYPAPVQGGRGASISPAGIHPASRGPTSHHPRSSPIHHSPPGHKQQHPHLQEGVYKVPSASTGGLSYPPQAYSAPPSRSSTVSLGGSGPHFPKMASAARPESLPGTSRTHHHSSATAQPHHGLGPAPPLPPPAHGGQPSTRPPHLSDVAAAMPLDLGAPLKRRTEPLEAPDAFLPRKSTRVDVNNTGIHIATSSSTSSSSTPAPTSSSSGGGGGMLFKVSEPSVLPASEPSTITTVVNAAVDSALGADHKVKAEQAPDAPSSVASSGGGGSGGGDKPYVHKLKKVWMQSYSGGDTAASSNNGSPSNSNPVTPQGSARATPSPAPSHHSSASSSTTRKSTNVAKAETRGKRSQSASLNGHSSPASKKRDESHSSTSESEDSRAPSRKRGRKVGAKSNGPSGSRPGSRQQPKRKGSSTPQQQINSGESHSDDSDKDVSGRDSDQSSATTTSSKKSKGKKRGRKPKRPNKEEPKEKRKAGSSSDDQHSGDRVVSGGPFRRPPTSQLKRTGESFLQDASCFDVAPKLSKCRECRWTQSQRNKKTPNIFCRFYAFRRLKYNKGGQLAVAGFCDPASDASKADLDLWKPQSEGSAGSSALTASQATVLLDTLKEDFQSIVDEEREALKVHVGEQASPSWKRVVVGVREMCDVCDATLFNRHWACDRCGFVVCVDCYRSKKSGQKPTRSFGDVNEKDRDAFFWLLCTTRQQHELDKLMLVQIIPGDAVEEMATAITALSTPTVNGDVKKEDGIKSEKKEELESVNGGKTPTEDSKSPCGDHDRKKEHQTAVTEIKLKTEKELKHFVRKSGKSLVWRHAELLGSPFGQENTRRLQSSVPHSWADGDKVLNLGAGRHDEAATIELFREAWRRGRPVVQSKATEDNDLKLWRPSNFAKNFGDVNADFIDLSSGAKISNETLSIFWGNVPPSASNASEKKSEDEMEAESKTAEDGRREKALFASSALRICDWPPNGDEFGEVLPEQAKDLFANLPLRSYTARSSPLNMGCLPDVFVRPDLGPRPCFSHGLGQDGARHKCSIRLHLEVADTVNMLFDVSEGSSKGKEGSKSVMELVEDLLRGSGDAKLDEAIRSRMADEPKSVGCFWQVFHPTDADKIRDYLNRRDASPSPRPPSEKKDDDDGEEEEGGKGPAIDPHFDPIHEADKFLDDGDLTCLREEYSVVPFNIVQFVGDAVFFPAGAPRQCRHLNTCISVSVDFASPESISHSYQLTQLSRQLSPSQGLSEDRLQAKNLVFHSVKKAVGVLLLQGDKVNSVATTTDHIKEEN